MTGEAAPWYGACRTLRRAALPLALALWFPRDTPAGWVIAFVDSTRDYSEERFDRTLRLDAAGRPHVVAGSWYMSHDGARWNFEEIASGCRHTSLGLDANGSPRVSYCAADHLCYAVRDSCRWHAHIVDSDSMTGLYSSIAFDGSGQPCISYQFHDPEHQDLRYAYREHAGWYVETVDTAGAAGFCTSLAFDGFGYPHISYYGERNLKHAYRDATGWHVETVDSCSWDGGPTTSLAVTRRAQPHISYFAGPHADLKYATKEGALWRTEILDDSGVTGMWSSLTLDAGGHVHVTHYDETHTDLKYGCRYDDVWLGERADAAGDVGWYSSLAVDDLQRPHVSYYDVKNRALKYGYRDRPFIGAQDPPPPSPAAARLVRLYPNPLTADVNVRYSLTAERWGRDARVSLRVYDTRGHLVGTLEELAARPGMHVSRCSLSAVPPGTYVLQLATGNLPNGDSRRVVVIR